MRIGNWLRLPIILCRFLHSGSVESLADIGTMFGNSHPTQQWLYENIYEPVFFVRYGIQQMLPPGGIEIYTQSGWVLMLVGVHHTMEQLAQYVTPL